LSPLSAAYLPVTFFANLSTTRPVHELTATANWFVGESSGDRFWSAALLYRLSVVASDSVLVLKCERYFCTLRLVVSTWMYVCRSHRFVSACVSL